MRKFFMTSWWTRSPWDFFSSRKCKKYGFE